MICDSNLYCSIPSNVDVRMSLPIGDQTKDTLIGFVKIFYQLILENVMFAPAFVFNVLSISSLTKSGKLATCFLSNKCFIHIWKLTRWLCVAVENGLYHLKDLLTCVREDQPVGLVLSASSSVSTSVWHARLGHVPYKKFCTLPIYGLSQCNINIVCDICQYARQKRLCFPVSISCTHSCFELIHTDIWDPFHVTSYDNFKYFLTIVDDFTRCTCVFLMTQKLEARQHIMNLCIMVKNQFDTTMKCIRSDNGHEFLFHAFYKSQGILHQRSCVATP